jgi:hypothetical protein
MEKIDLSIIIVNYRSRTYLEKCLASLYAKIEKNVLFEVLVVNNGKDDELGGLEALFPVTKIIQNKKNTGFGSANNLGAKEARGALLFFLNPDTELISRNISSVMDEFGCDPTLGVLGVRAVTSQKKVQKWIVGGEVTLWHILRNNFRFSGDEKYWQSENKITVFWVAGTALFIPRSFFFQLGGFDEHFFAYFEDVDLCRRARSFGRKVIYFPTFSVLHHGGKSFAVKADQKKNYYQSQNYYFKKHLGFFQAQLLKILRFFSF